MFITVLEELIRQKGITSAKMLSDLDMNKSSVLNWKTRGTIPGGDVLIKLADYFAVPVDYLLGRENVPAPHDEIAELSACLTAEERRIVADYIRFLISQRKDAGGER